MERSSHVADRQVNPKPCLPVLRIPLTVTLLKADQTPYNTVHFGNSASENLPKRRKVENDSHSNIHKPRECP